MTQVTADLVVSLDGYAAGPNQSADLPFGEGVDERLHRWMFEGAQENAAELAGINGAGAYVMGRNMFGPGRGDWDLEWTGWWGPEPPYQAPVFVLTHHEREPVALEGTTFHFVTAGIEAALQSAVAAAGDGRVAIAGGAATINQYLAADLIDELRLHVAPVLLGAGERLFSGVGSRDLQFVGGTSTQLVQHLTYRFD